VTRIVLVDGPEQLSLEETARTVFLTNENMTSEIMEALQTEDDVMLYRHPEVWTAMLVGLVDRKIGSLTLFTVAQDVSATFLARFVETIVRSNDSKLQAMARDAERYRTSPGEAYTDSFKRVRAAIERFSR